MVYQPTFITCPLIWPLKNSGKYFYHILFHIFWWNVLVHHKILATNFLLENLKLCCFQHYRPSIPTYVSSVLYIFSFFPSIGRNISKISVVQLWNVIFFQKYQDKKVSILWYNNSSLKRENIVFQVFLIGWAISWAVGRLHVHCFHPITCIPFDLPSSTH